MKKIVLFCAGGMSTSILVRNMLGSADRAGFDCSIAAYAASEASRFGRDADCILLGPQIRFQKDGISRQCPGVPIDSIDMKTYGKADGAEALRQAVKLMAVNDPSIEGRYQFRGFSSSSPSYSSSSSHSQSDNSSSSNKIAQREIRGLPAMKD